MIKLIKHNSPFFISLLIFVGFISTLLIIYNKQEAHLIANQFYSPFFDSFFYYTTQLVEEYITPLILLFVFIFWSFKEGVIFIAAYILSGVITQFLKIVVFSESLRPTLELQYKLRLIPDYFNFKHSYFNSFPSGHTTAAFSIFVILTCITKNKKWGYVYGILAILVGFSRIYLSQHFFEDILVGSLIGTFISLGTYYWLNRYSFGVLSRYSLIRKK